MKRKAQANCNLIGDYTSQKEKKEIAEFLQDLNAADLTGWLHSSIILNKNVWLRWRVRCKRGALSLSQLSAIYMEKCPWTRYQNPNLLLRRSRSCMDYSWMVTFPASEEEPSKVVRGHLCVTVIVYLDHELHVWWWVEKLNRVCLLFTSFPAR